MRNLLIAAIAYGLLVPAADALDYAPNCEETLVPVRSIAPVLPAQSRDEFPGSVVAYFTVLPNGEVYNASVFPSDLDPAQDGREELAEYDDAVLDALRLWRYPVRQESCLHKATIKLR